MYLTAFLHRDELFEITNRWLSDSLDKEDPLEITKIITYDSFVAWESLLSFIDNLIKSLTESQIIRKSISRKKELKDFVNNIKYQKTDRIGSLISEYMQNPEFYYIGSPITGNIYHDPALNILGMCRIKRVRRIAEKASRYASIYIFGELQTMGHKIIEEGSQNLSMAGKIPPEVFDKAEKNVMQNIKDKGTILPVESMTIKDILGVKIIDYGYGKKRLESAISGLSGIRIVEKERHEGRYNATHYIVELDVDLNDMMKKFNRNSACMDFAKRGLPAEKLSEDFNDFILTGADNVQVDLIFTSIEEFIESEIGRSMHEKRIFKQRQQKGFNCNILMNLEYIIEYLLAVGMSPTVYIDEIPIKIWGRYLPDTISYLIRKLYRIPEYSLVG